MARRRHGAREKKARRAEAGRAGAARGWAEARRARGLCWAGLRGWAESEAAAREGEKLFFIYIFKNFFKGQLLNIILSKKMTSFENVPKMKVD